MYCKVACSVVLVVSVLRGGIHMCGCSVKLLVAWCSVMSYLVQCHSWLRSVCLYWSLLVVVVRGCVVLIMLTRVSACIVRGCYWLFWLVLRLYGLFFVVRRRSVLFGVVPDCSVLFSVVSYCVSALLCAHVCCSVL